MTCHNRKEKTLRCLDSIFNQKATNNISIQIYLVDDGSTDGTYKAISKKYPMVKMLRGDGNLYWNKGMHKAMDKAKKDQHDFYLWLNDDVELYSNALELLLSSFKKKEKKLGVIVGSVCDPESQNWTYGASVRSSIWHPLRFRPLKPKGKIEKADNFYGNVVLIPKEIAYSVGNLDPRFAHGGGDHDYALRVIKKGFYIWNAPRYVGTCKHNPPEDTWRDESLTLLERYRNMLSRKELHMKTRLIYLKKHGGTFFPVLFMLPYLRLPFSHLKSKIKSIFKS